MARVLLCGLGVAPGDAEHVVSRFREHDEHVLYEHQDMHEDEEKMTQISMAAAEELETLFRRDDEDSPEPEGEREDGAQ